MQVMRNTVLFNISYIVFMAIQGLAQYQPQMTAEFIMTDKIEVSLVIKGAYSDIGNESSVLNVVNTFSASPLVSYNLCIPSAWQR